MSRSDRRADASRAVDRIAHAFTPVAWSGRWLVAGIVVFGAVATLTVVQRALIADDAVGWVFTSIHGLVVAVVVPALTIRTVREWRAVRRVL